MKIIKLSAIDSTNDYLKSLHKEEALEDGLIVSAKRQLKGRGQQGSHWFMEEGKSLAFSVFKVLPSMPVSDQFILTMAVSIAIKKVLTSLGVPAVSIKWPNDIMAADKKVCGVLIESQLSGTYLKSAVIGVGLNVNNTNFNELPYAGSMKLATGATFNLDDILLQLAASISSEIEQSMLTPFQEIQRLYHEQLFRREKIAVFESSNKIRFNGIIKGINSKGALLVETEDHSIQKFQLKEIKLLL